MFNHILVGLAIWVKIYVLTSMLVQYNVFVERFDPKQFFLVVICQIHTDASKTYIILILQDLILLMVFHFRKVVEHIVPFHYKHHQSRNFRDTELPNSRTRVVDT